jgi:deazaflavin-dependent oxidoreductase (nitroreductase family)
MPQTNTHMTYFHVITYMLSGRRLYRGDANSAAGFLRLMTVGRKTGKQRTVDLLYIRDGSAYVVTASNGGAQRDPGWLFNMRSTPDVTIEVQGVRRRAVAEVADPEKRRELWARLVNIAPFYQGYAKRTQREIQMVILHPLDAS